VAGARVRLAAAALLCCLALGCGGSRGDDGPSATVAAGSSSSLSTSTSTTIEATTTTTTEPAPQGLEQEVEDAYLHSWDVYTEAMLRLDPTRLGEVYAGDALDLRRREIASAPGPVRVHVDHDYEIAVVGADTALIFETYRNHSVYLDGTTMQPIEPDPNNVLSREYVLQKEPPGWRVTQVNAGS
jgi:hypothetical protein